MLYQDGVRSRIHAVMDALEPRLHDALTLDDIAKLARYSRFHLERVFAEYAGQTPIDYLRRRRLQTAAARIRHELTPLAQIGFESSYGSHAAFSKAFRQAFGYSARDWRAGAWRAFMDENLSQALQIEPVRHAEFDRFYTISTQYRPLLAADINVRSLPPRPYYYCRWQGASLSNFDADTAQVRAHATALGLLDAQTPCVGIIREDNGIAPMALFAIDFGVAPVKPKPVATPGLTMGRIPGGDYAVMPFSGPVPLRRWMHELWRRMHEQWLERQQHYCLDGSRPYVWLGWGTHEVESGQLLLPVRRGY